MELRSLDIADVKLVVPTLLRDARGSFTETYNRRRFSEAGIDVEFVQDNQSLSYRAGTVRGLHFQTPPEAQAKLVRVGAGAIFDVAVDIRPHSPTYGQHVAVTLSAEDGAQLWIPQGFAHGYCTLEADTVVLYKTTAFYAPEHDCGIRWNDPALGIAWPVPEAEAILSDKDRVQPMLAQSAAFTTS
jgi:dTDP-4-dehydrorhamnose 3,5-epimerase